MDGRENHSDKIKYLNELFFSKKNGSLLKERRNFIGISGETLGFLVGLSQQQVSRYENGKTAFSIEMLFNFMDALEMDTAEIEMIFISVVYLYATESI